MSGGDHPFGINQHAAAPVADEAEFRMQQLKRHLPRPRAPSAGLAVEDAPGGGGGGRGGDRERAAVLRHLAVLQELGRHDRARLPLRRRRTSALCVIQSGLCSFFMCRRAVVRARASNRATAVESRLIRYT